MCLFLFGVFARQGKRRRLDSCKLLQTFLLKKGEKERGRGNAIHFLTAGTVVRDEFLYNKRYSGVNFFQKRLKSVSAKQRQKDTFSILAI